MKIALLDDRPTELDKWQDQLADINADYDIELITDDELRSVVAELQKRRKSADVDDPCQLDDFDVLIADYDLRDADIGLTTGADIARLVRCYSHCTVIILMNAYRGPNRDRRFDLHLTAELDLFSDFEIGSKFLANPGLWIADREQWPNFRPWSWPAVEELNVRLKRVAETLRDQRADPVAGVIPALGDHMSLLMKEELEWLGDAPNELTISDLRGGTGNDARASQLAPMGRDVVPDAILPTYAASRLVKWLDQFVLVRQTSLVDAPHLVSRHPGVLTDGPSTTARLDKAAIDALIEPLQDRVSLLGQWCSRPVWWADVVETDEAVRESLKARRPERSDRVFCEDVSQFLSRADARDFALDIGTPYRRRWVSSPDRIELGEYQPDYQPAQWFAM